MKSQNAGVPPSPIFSSSWNGPPQNDGEIKQPRGVRGIVNVL